MSGRFLPRLPPPAEAPLRTVFCTSGGVHGALVLRRLLACPAIELCGIVHSTRVLDARYGFARGAIEQIRRSGLRYAVYLFCATSLADALRPLAGALPGGDDALARARRVPALATRDLNDAAGLAFLRARAPELLVSAFFNQRLHAPALGVARLGSVNIHPSLLPDLKGVDPGFQARLLGQPLGVTVHRMTPELDTGRILVRQAVAVPAQASVLAATALLFDAGAQALVGALAHIRRGDAGDEQQGPGSYQSWPTPAQVRALRARGGALLRPADLALLAGRR